MNANIEQSHKYGKAETGSIIDSVSHSRRCKYER